MTRKPQSLIPEGKEDDYPTLNFFTQLDGTLTEILGLSRNIHRINSVNVHKNILTGIERRL